MTCCRVPRKQATTKTEHSLLIPKSFYSCDLKEMKFHETKLYVYNIGLALGPTQKDTRSPDMTDRRLDKKKVDNYSFFASN